MANTDNTPTGFGLLVADISAVESYTGKDDGRTHYLARCEVPTCPGSRWGTVRVTVTSDAPFEAGRYNLVVRMYDGVKGEARCRIIGRA